MTDLHTLWTAIIERLAAAADPEEYRDFLLPLRPIEQSGRSLVLEAPSRLAMQVVTTRYAKTIEAILHEMSAGSVTHVSLRVRRAEQQELFPGGAIVPATSPDQRPGSNLSPKYTFRTFVVGASNQFAHAACRAVANHPGKPQHNPLFIYGGVGLGKTHLVNAVGNHILARQPDAHVLYLSAEAFMNALIQAIRQDRIADLNSRLEAADVLILDDVQVLSRKERTQDQFFHTFNTLYHKGRQIVITSDKYPKEIPDLEERLRNRFEWGLIADIQPPDVETRVAILQRKAELERIALPADVALFVAGRIDSNVRELEGALNRLAAFSSLQNVPITLELARDVLRNLLGGPEDSGVSIHDIERLVCDQFHLSSCALRSKRRSREVAGPRQLAMYLCRKYTRASFPAIGDHFGGRDHSTVIHAVQVVERRIEEDPAFREVVTGLERRIQQGGASPRAVSGLERG